MATQVQWRGGSTAEHATFTGAAREVTVDTQKQTLVLHDGSTAGGRPLLREDGSNAALALGSAGTPSLKFTGDPNTGIYSPGADQLAVATNGTGRLFVGADGKVAVGNSAITVADGAMIGAASSTGARLKLCDSDLGVTATDGFEIFAADGGDAYIWQRENNPLLIGTNGAERLRITSAGLVGIGTSAPAYGLEVNNQNIAITNRPTTGTDNPVLFLRRNVEGGDASAVTTHGTIAFQTDYAVNGTFATSASVVAGSSNGTSVNTYFALSTRDSGNTLAERMRLNSTGLGIGTTSPSVPLDVVGIGRFSGGGGYVSFGDNGYIRTDAANELRFQGGTNGTTFWKAGLASESARIDNSGRLLVGTSTSGGRVGATLQIAASGAGYLFEQRYAESNASGADLFLTKSRGTIASPTIVSSGDNISIIRFSGYDGASYLETATITSAVDGTPGASDMPGRLVFSTTADGAASPTERMRIDNQGGVFINRTTGAIITSSERLTVVGAATIQRSSGTGLHIDRTTNDGNLVEFYQDTAIEGSISVSGNTVSYNGAHLSRWSQLLGGAERTEILRGSVLSNIDEMCEWGEEDNEQLNRMKVSDVEGDKNVSGVFQAWDDDDDTYTNDFYCAMTGDFVIRIAGDVTVERGDLLMSAGDGTAKPQDDDIIRSKTIAKVTSTNVSCTYPDGSYCVPCVLMAC